jgi:hypothetical protein
MIIISIIMINIVINIVIMIIIIVLEVCPSLFLTFIVHSYFYVLMSIYVQHQHQLCPAVAAETRRSWICRTLMFLLAIVVVSPGALRTMPPDCHPNAS